MEFLLDTHTLIWFFNGDRKLSENSKTIIQDINTNKFISVASIWEMSIKQSKGKLHLQSSIEEIVLHLVENGVDILNINTTHALKVKALNFHHKDPFDRMLIAQAMVEQLQIISVDKIFDAYGVERVW